MIKRTLFFGNPVYLSTKNKQLIVNYPDEQPTKTAAIEDIGVVVLENQQITITNGLLERLISNNVAVITCNAQHLPVGLLMPLDGNTEQSERFRYQVEASLPLKKNLWQQTVQAKIRNQAHYLKERRGVSIENMLHWVGKVTSGDTQNHEARAAAYYWQNMYDIEGFNRFRTGIPPNNLLNYGYAILRAITARALVSSGLNVTMGIFHRNRYNSYCLADDIMEPYRPYVDMIVGHLVDTEVNIEEITTHLKKELLALPTLDVLIDGKKSPLLVALSRTTYSLYECFAGESRKILYPEF